MTIETLSSEDRFLLQHGVAGTAQGEAAVSIIDQLMAELAKRPEWSNVQATEDAHAEACDARDRAESRAKHLTARVAELEEKGYRAAALLLEANAAAHAAETECEQLRAKLAALADRAYPDPRSIITPAERAVLDACEKATINPETTWIADGKTEIAVAELRRRAEARKTKRATRY